MFQGQHRSSVRIRAALLSDVPQQGRLLFPRNIPVNKGALMVQASGIMR